MILVSGGTGLVGSRVVSLLLEQNQPVRVLSRGLSDWKASIMPQFRHQGVDVVVGDLQDRNFVEKAVDGCKVIINTSGSISGFVEKNKDGISASLTSIGNLIDSARRSGIQRFVQLSCLGATEHSTSRYFFAKWQEEQVIKQGGYYWTIFRPSLIFGHGSKLNEILGFLIGSAPFIPIIGSGLNKIQLVSADDVAQCIVQCIYNKDTTGQSYDLVGPITYTFEDLLKIACHGMVGRNKPVIHIPTKIGLKLAKIITTLNPACPINEEVLKVIVTELVGDDSRMRQLFPIQQQMFENSLSQLPAKGRT